MTLQSVALSLCLLRGARTPCCGLRATVRTRLALAGVSSYKLQKLMRHGTIELTMKYYARLAVGDLADQGLDFLSRIEATQALEAESHSIQEGVALDSRDRSTAG